MTAIPVLESYEFVIKMLEFIEREPNLSFSLTSEQIMISDKISICCWGS